MDLMHDKRGFYLVSPLAGTIFFLMTITAAAFILNEDAQYRRIAEVGYADRLTYVAQAIEADVFDVLIQNKMQGAMDGLSVYSETLLNATYRTTMDSLTKNIDDGYGPAYVGNFSVECHHEEEISPGPYIFFKRFSGGSRIIDDTGMAEIRAIPSGHKVECRILETGRALNLTLLSRTYSLFADCICAQAPLACSDTFPAAYYQSLCDARRGVP